MSSSPFAPPTSDCTVVEIPQHSLSVSRLGNESMYVTLGVFAMWICLTFMTVAGSRNAVQDHALCLLLLFPVAAFFALRPIMKHLVSRSLLETVRDPSMVDANSQDFRNSILTAYRRETLVMLSLGALGILLTPFIGHDELRTLGFPAAMLTTFALFAQTPRPSRFRKWLTRRELQIPEELMYSWLAYGDDLP